MRRREPRAARSASLSNEHAPNPVVALTMTNERGEQVYSTTSRLADWNWSSGWDKSGSAFVYKSGVATELRVSAGTTKSRREGVGADGGWGSYFISRRDGRYTLSLDVEQSDADAATYEVALEVRGVVGCL